MSDPGDGDEPTDPPEGASDEEVRAAMSRVGEDVSPSREPHDRVPPGYGSAGGESGDGSESDNGTGSTTAADGTPSDDAMGSGPADGSAPTDPELRQADLSAPASATDGEHTLLEEYEREQESVWKGRLRTAAFWLGATGVSVAVTLTAIVSLTSSGLSDGVAFILASVGMAVIVGFVFLSIRA